MIFKMRPTGIAMAILIRVIFFGCIGTLILTALQLAISYRSERAMLEGRFTEINQATARSLSAGLWAMDSKSLEQQLDGILLLPSIRAVEVRDMPSSGPAFSVSRGERLKSAVVARDFPLICCGTRPEQIGVLHIEATLSDIYRLLARQAISILLNNAATIFLIAFVILLLVHRLATRHVLHIATATANVAADCELPPLTLQRSSVRHDELDELVDALNGMRKRLRDRALELRNANLRMAAILDNIPDLAWVKDREGRIIAANRALATSVGFAQPIELLGKTDNDLHAPEVAHAYLRDDAEVMRSKQWKRIEESLVHADGTLKWIETIKTALPDADGQIVGTVGIARDVTERKRATEALHEVQAELAHANRVATMGQLAASIAHEVNQPIAATVTNAHAAMRWLACVPPDLDRVGRALDRIVNDGARAGEVLGRIRELIKKTPPKREAFRINEAVLEVVELADVEAKKKQVLILTQLSSDSPVIEADRVQIQQVLLNLIVNAIEAMSGMTSGAREVLVSTGHAHDGWLLVSVSDSGPGLRADESEQIFAPFYTTKAGGLGMGLSICRSIVEGCGGQLVASANSPRGTTFRFTVPLHLEISPNEHGLRETPAESHQSPIPE